MATTYSDDNAACGALVEQLSAAFSSTYQAHYTQGMNLVFEDKQDTALQRKGPPCILFGLDDASKDSDWSAANSVARRVVLNAVIQADDNNGAKQGESNPTPIDKTMAADLVQEIEGGYAAYRDAGFYDIRVRANREDVRKQEGAPPQDRGPLVHRNPHQVSFVYFVS